MRPGGQRSLFDSLYVWWTAGGERSAVESCSLVDTGGALVELCSESTDEQNEKLVRATLVMPENGNEEEIGCDVIRRVLKGTLR